MNKQSTPFQYNKMTMFPFIVWLFGVVGVLIPNFAHSQSNAIRYDLRKFNLGFNMGLNVSMVRLYYRDLDYNARLRRGLMRIDVQHVPGINLGMICNAKLLPLFDLRFVPAISLQQRNFVYRFANDSSHLRKLEAAYVDLPLMLKFKSTFYNNHRVYVMAGFKASINLVSDKRVQNDPDLIKIEKMDYSWEFAFGIDIYGDRVKLSPEIRYSLGIRNIYVPDNTSYGNAISGMTSQSLLFCLNFE